LVANARQEVFQVFNLGTREKTKTEKSIEQNKTKTEKSIEQNCKNTVKEMIK
jgi:hypothetical protein